MELTNKGNLKMKGQDLLSSNSSVLSHLSIFQYNRSGLSPTNSKQFSTKLNCLKMPGARTYDFPLFSTKNFWMEGIPKRLNRVWRRPFLSLPLVKAINKPFQLKAQCGDKDSSIYIVREVTSTKTLYLTKGLRISKARYWFMYSRTNNR